MPTGFTAPVEKGEITALPDFALLCARGLGPTIAMRDMSFDAPLTKENLSFDTSHNVTAIIAAEDRIKEVEAWTPEEAAEEARKYNQARLKEFLKGKRERKHTAQRYGALLVQVEAWTPPTADHEGLKDYMAEQLERSLEHDCYDAERPQKVDGPTLQAQEIESAQRTIAFQSERLVEGEVANARRIGWVEALQESLADWEPVEAPAPTRRLP